MKLTTIKSIIAAAAVAVLCAWNVRADKVEWQGVTVDYGNASTNWVGGELVLTYTNVGEDTLKLGGMVKADILLVGGGGSGSSGGKSGNRPGYGGSGGKVVPGQGVELSGESNISVGSGGAAVKSTSSFSRASGKQGDSTSIGGALDLKAEGGAAGGGDAVSGGGTTNDISGVSVTYGVDGESRESSSAVVNGAANTGNGGSGGYAQATSGAGGSGVAIIRLKKAYVQTSVTLEDMTLGVGEEVSDFADKATGKSVDIFFSEVTSVSFDPEGVVRGERMKDGRFAFVGSNPGSTEAATKATIRIVNKEKMTLTTYTANLTVTPSVSLKDLSIQRGETTAALVSEDTPINLNYDDAKVLKSSVPEIADFVKLSNGKIGVVGKVTGTVGMTIVTAGQSYQFTVTVEKLLNGLYKAGAYDVAVSNASDVSYVDGDLVLIYRNVDAAVKKSFELPKATTGRLLAVGGGGAGGQEPGARIDTYGLPGGGGAGGMILNDSQSFAAAIYTVTVGAGGVAPRTAPSKATAGASGAASTVSLDGDVMLTAKGGGGGGARSVGQPGGSGGGGSFSGGTSGSKNGGAASQSDGYANAGGRGASELFGGGGGGAGGKGGDTGSYSAFYNKSRRTFTDPTTADVYLSGAGGIGMTSDITGESLEYARGGAGGVPRLYAYYYYKNGTLYYTDKKPTDSEKSSFDGGKYFWCEASDGKPGRDGYGDGGGGGSYFSKDYGPTFAGSGGNGVVIVRIPPYKTTVEDALKAAFAGQPVTVSGSTVTLTADMTAGIAIPDDLGEVKLVLNGHAITGADGAPGDDITAGGDGQPALEIVAHDVECGAGATTVSVTGTGTLKGGAGGDGHPQGRGAAAVAGSTAAFNIAQTVTQTVGTDGKFVAQHSHQWAYRVEGGKIVATCRADGDCSYKTHEPFIAVRAADAAFTGKWYEGLMLENTITAATGESMPPPTFEGIEGTDYPQTSVAPVEQGKYRVTLAYGGRTISDTFAIVDAKPEQDTVYKSWKTATRVGDSVDIRLTATFSGSCAINHGNVLLLGSRCDAHSMATGTVEKTINAMTKYANVRWYAFGETDAADNNHLGELTRKGETLSYTEKSGKVTDETVHLAGNNHFVHKEMMNALYEELIEKKNLQGDYNLILLEFDGDLLCREGVAPYQLNYELPEGWDDEKAAQLRAVMEKYYEAGRVVWIVPDVNQPKTDAGHTGEYPWTSKPEFIWQRAFLGATETEGYRNPLQKNYEDADELVKYIDSLLIGGYFQNMTISDTVKDGLDIKAVTPQVRDRDGFWMDMQKVSPNGDVGGTFSITEPTFGVPITATVTVTDGQKVEIVFDMSNVQRECKARDLVWGNDLQVKINASIEKSFFNDVASGEWKETNEGHAIFTFNSSLLDETFVITTSNAPPKIQNVVQLCVFVKPPLVSSGRLRELIGVPWKGADGKDVLLDAYVDKEDLTVGDQLFVYNRSTKGYDSYVLNGEKMWQAAKTLCVKDGAVTGTVAADPKEVRVPVGLATWIERQDASKPITFRGLPAEGEVDFGLKTGYNLVSGPGPKPFGLEGILTSAEGDRVILPRYGAEPQVFVYEAAGWTFKTNAIKSVGGEAVVVPTKVTEPTLMTVPPGFGFWYEKKQD